MTVVRRSYGRSICGLIVAAIVAAACTSGGSGQEAALQEASASETGSATGPTSSASPTAPTMATGATSPTGPTAERSLPTIPSEAEPAFPAQGPPGGPPEAEAIPETPAAPPMSDAEWEELENLAGSSEHGTVPVIVELRVRTEPEGALGKSEVAAQRRAIAVSGNAVLAELKGKGFGSVVSYDAIPFIALHVSPRALAGLRRSPNVVGVSEDREIPLPQPITPQATTSFSGDVYPWWHWYRMNIDDSTKNGYNGYRQTVAIIDTGVWSDHPWLRGKVVKEACFAKDEAGKGWCPNGLTSQIGTGAARPCSQNTNLFAFPDDCSHGTHVAGIAAGTYGVAWRANIIAVQVFHPTYCENLGYVCPNASDSDIVSALNWIYGLRKSYAIAAVNLSLGGGKFGSYCDSTDTWSRQFYTSAANLRYNRDAPSYAIATVAASGNDGYRDGIAWPACTSNVVSVGNTSLDFFSGQDAVWVDSNSGDTLSLLAPGSAICSAVITLQGWLDDWCYGGSVPAGGPLWYGTSMAAPAVTGAFAALKQLRYWASVSSQLTALQKSGVPVSDGYRVTRSRIDVWQALIYLYNH